MAKLIDLDYKRELSYCSPIRTRDATILELIGTVVSTVFNNPVHNEASIFNQTSLIFSRISDVNSTSNSPLLPCILYGVNVKSTGVLKLCYDLFNLTWEHVINIPSRRLLI